MTRTSAEQPQLGKILVTEEWLPQTSDYHICLQEVHRIVETEASKYLRR